MAWKLLELKQNPLFIDLYKLHVCMCMYMYTYTYITKNICIHIAFQQVAFIVFSPYNL